MRNIVFVHGMFQNPKSWGNWVRMFSSRGYNCIAPAWPLHEGEPSHLRANPPAGLGELHLKTIMATIQSVTNRLDNPIMIGHSVGGLITQVFLNKGLIGAGIAIDSVAPNKMLDFDWGFFKNTAVIANPLKGSEPIFMDEKTFHGSFANTLSQQASDQAFAEFATHDSRNVLRDCMGPDGQVDLDARHSPLLLIAGEKDQIIPAHLTEKNAKAYTDLDSVTSFKEFEGRSHYICGEPGWEEVAKYAADWLEQQESSKTVAVSQQLLAGGARS
jgi:pimeloyl-ACP methyl ester carboxylesterase